MVGNEKIKNAYENVIYIIFRYFFVTYHYEICSFNTFIAIYIIIFSGYDILRQKLEA